MDVCAKVNGNGTQRNREENLHIHVTAFALSRLLTNYWDPISMSSVPGLRSQTRAYFDRLLKHNNAIISAVQFS